MASCENKYITLLDLSRQAKVITGETACFDGKIQVGLPFSGYPTGVDTGTTVSLGIVSSETAVFSGNTGTTIFDVSNTSSPNYDALFSGYSGTVWTNDLFSGNTSGLTLPITPLSADTQIVGPFWTLTKTGMTGDYVIGTEYTGYSITYSVSQLQEISFITGFTAYSGFSSASQENFSAGTLDYKGPLDYISSVEDATIDGRLTTNKLTVTGGASASTIGYVLTQLDETGKAGWVFNSASASTNTFVTGGTLNGTNLDLTWNTGGSVPSIELSGLTYWVIENGGLKDINANSLSISNTSTGSIMGGGTLNVIAGLSDFSVIMGGGSNTISSSLDGSIIGGSSNTISGEYTNFICAGSNNYLTNTRRSAIIGGQNITGTSYDTVYVPNLNIGTIGTGTSINNLGIDVNGNVVSGSTYTGNTSGDCITDLYLTNLYGCSPLHIEPSGVNDVYIVENGGNVGIGTTTPTEKLHVSGGDILVEYGTGKLISDLTNVVGPVFRLSGGTGTLSYYSVLSPGFGATQIGVRGGTEASKPGYGKQGDGFIYSSADQNGLNIISEDGGASLDDYIRFYAGQTNGATPANTPDIHIQGSGTTRGNVGINTKIPTSKLDINGDNGYNQLRVRTTYTPTSAADGNGDIGDICWDDDYFYVKTNNGWGRTTLDYGF